MLLFYSQNTLDLNIVYTHSFFFVILKDNSFLSILRTPVIENRPTLMGFESFFCNGVRVRGGGHSHCLGW